MRSPVAAWVPEAKIPPEATKEVTLVKLPEESILWVPPVWSVWGLKVPPESVPKIEEEAEAASKGPET